MRHTNWGLVEDQVAIKDGKLPNAIVSKDERRGRVKDLMTQMLELAAKLNISGAAMARELGVARINLYRWRDGASMPGMENYCKLLELFLKLEEEAFKGN